MAFSLILPRELGSGQQATAAQEAVGLDSGRVTLPSALGAAQTSALRIVCAISLANASLWFLVTLAGGPSPFRTTVATGWVIVCWLLFDRARELPRLFARRPALLVLLGAAGVMPIALDGGLDSTLTTQAMWLTWIAAVTISARLTVAMAAIMAIATAAALAASASTAHELLTGPSRFEATLLVFNPVVTALAGLALVGVFRHVLGNAAGTLAAVRAGGPASTPGMARLLHREPPRLLEAPPPSLTTAEEQILALLHDGLTPKQIALHRGTTVMTVRTQIKSIKRKTGALSLSHLVRRTWRSS